MSNKKGKKKKGSVPSGAPAGSSRRAIFSRIRSGVVGIVNAPDDLIAAKGAIVTPADNPFKKMQVVGSGFIVDQGGIAVTAAHVVRPWREAVALFAQGKGPRPPMIKVLTHGPVTTSGNAVEWAFALIPVIQLLTNDRLDLAVLKLGTPPAESGLRFNVLPLSPVECEEGDEIAVCGYPLGQHLHRDLMQGLVLTASFSGGIVSAVLPYPWAPVNARTVFQISGMLNPGNSGGPVFDVRTGNVVGLVVSIATSPMPQPKVKQIPLPPPVDPPSTPEPQEPQPAPEQPKGQLIMPAGLARAVPIGLVRRAIALLLSSAVQTSVPPTARPPEAAPGAQ